MQWQLLLVVAWVGLAGGLTMSGVQIVASNLSFGRKPTPPGHTPMARGLLFLAIGGAMLLGARPLLDLLPR